jgi:predicted Na+-dependent transporter
MALSWAIICTVVGIALGLRFKVLVLVPAIALAVIFALIVGVARGDSFWSIVLVMVIVGTAIQLGYLVGIFLADRIQ